MTNPRVFADFNNADPQGRVRLNCIGTIQDLNELQLVLQPGLAVTIYSESLEVSGVVQFSEEEGIWVADIDWDEIQDLEATSSSPAEQAVPRRHRA